MGMQFATATQASADVIGTECSGGSIQIIAHQDDDLLFQSPDILSDVDAGRCVRTVYVTAGDSGYDDDYWESRESGAEAAWAEMADVSNSWMTSTISLAGKSVRMRTLTDSPNVSLIFMRLPDGFPLGTGSAAQGYQSLYRLLTGAISTVTAVDGSASYNGTTLRSALLAAIQDNSYTWIRTQDYVTYYGGDQDHYDHHSVAYLAEDATYAYERDSVLSSYLGYGDFVSNGSWPANIDSDDLERKTDVFATYADYDDEVDIDQYEERGWLNRQYVIAIDGNAAAADAGLDQTVTVGTKVTLNASGSTGVSGLSYSWSQTSGTTVTLSSTTSSTAAFTPTTAGSYVFAVTVSCDGESSTASVTITVTGSTATPSGVFTDVDTANQFYTEIMWLAANGISTGWDAGGGSYEFRPLQPVARDAMAAFLYRLAGSPSYTPPSTSPFSDVDTTNQFYKEICWLASEGITTGYSDGTFRPLESVARDAMAAFLYRYAGTVMGKDTASYLPSSTSAFSDVATDNEFYTEISWLADEGISTGYEDGTFRPLSEVNRDAMAAFMYRLAG
ncbi:MAG: hypothetical protein GX440_08885 [Propionibacterium sp.]|nr:hypothetical protein [Propionibacterium sp.]